MSSLLLFLTVLVFFSSPTPLASAMSFVSNTSLTDGIDRIECSVADDSGHIFFGTFTAPGVVMKSDMKTLTNLGSVFFYTGEDFVSSLVFDFNNYVYASTYSTPTAYVIKIQANTMQRVGSVALPSRNLNAPPDPTAIQGQLHLISAGVFLPAPLNALVFSTDTEPTRIVKIPVADFTFRDEFVVTLQNKENAASSFVLAKNFLLVGLQTSPAKVVHLDPQTLAAQYTLTFQTGEDYITQGFHMGALPMVNNVVNPANVPAADTNIFYFLCYGSTMSKSKIVKVQGSTSAIPSLVEVETYTFVSPESQPRSVVPLPWMNKFVVGLSLWPGIVVVFDISSGSMQRSWSTWISTADRYFSTGALVTPFDISSTTTPSTTTITTTTTSSPTTTANTSTSTSINPTTTGATPTTTSSLPTTNELRIIFATDSGAASAVTYLPNIQNFSDAVMVYRGGESLATTGRLFGENIFLATDTRPAIVIKMAADTLQNIAALRLPLGDDWVRFFAIDKFGFGHLGLCTTVGRLVRFATTDMTRLSAIDGDASEDCFHTGVFSPQLETATSQILFVSSLYGANTGTASFASSVLKFQVTATGVTLLTRTTTSFPDSCYSGVTSDPRTTTGGLFYSIYGTYTSTGLVTKLDLTSGLVASTLLLPSGEGPAREVAATGTYTYLAVSPKFVAPGIVKVFSGSAISDQMYRVTKFNFGLAEPFYSIVPVSTSSSLALLGTGSSDILLVDLASGSTYQSLPTSTIQGVWEGGISVLPLPSSSPATTQSPASSTIPNPNIAWMMTYSSPSSVLKIDTTVINNSAPSDDKMAIIVGGGIAIAFLLMLVIILLYLKSRKTRGNNYNNNNDNNNDQPMLQVPTTQVTTFHHTAMSVPTRDDMYSNRVVVPPPSGYQNPDYNRLDEM